LNKNKKTLFFLCELCFALQLVTLQPLYKMKSLRQLLLFKSASLNKTVSADLIMPANTNKNINYPLLILNDGQDVLHMHLKLILEQVWAKNWCKPFILIAPHTKDRMNEYGVANHPDYKNRGYLANAYSQFICSEMLPQLKNKLDISSFESIAIAGFSLGGLSAFDIAWNHPEIFSKVGAFSASFWWRKKELNEQYTDADRIMHQVVKTTLQKPNLNIWLQCGTLDEFEDRNHNGIIDSIDDTLDLINDLEDKGFETNKDLFYTETIGGKHTMETYAIMLPHFFKWAF